jgi:lipopolysaccharide transport system permease protein
MLRDLATSIWAGRELAWRLFVRDTSAQFRQTFAGYAWAFFPPLINALTFVFLNSQGLFEAGDTGAVPYAAFAMMGTLLWQVFVDSMQMPLQQLQMARSMLVKINFPRESILIAGVYKVLFNFLIRLVLLIGILIVFKVSFTWEVVFFPVAMLGLIFCGACVGLALVPIGGLYGDFQKLLPMVATFWMLLTPVVYPPRTEGVLGWLATWNPVSPVLTTARQSLTGDAFTHLTEFAVVSGGAFGVLLLGLVAFRLAMPHLIERMGG